MKVRWFCFVGVIVLASLAAGCKSPSGSSSFTKFENPFKSNPFKSFSKKPLADSAKASTEVAEKNSANPRPSLGERPNISSPVGGYSTAAATTADSAQREAVQRDAQAIQGSYVAAAEPYPYHAVASQSLPVQQSPYEAAYSQQYSQQYSQPQPYAAANPVANNAATPAAGYSVPAGYTPTAYGVPQTPSPFQEPVATPGYGAPSAPQVYDNPYGTPAYAAAPTTATPETPYYSAPPYSGNSQVSPYGYR